MHPTDTLTQRAAHKDRKESPDGERVSLPDVELKSFLFSSIKIPSQRIKLTSDMIAQLFLINYFRFIFR